MVFSSLFFLFVFLPAVLAGYGAVWTLCRCLAVRSGKAGKAGKVGKAGKAGKSGKSWKAGKAGKVMDWAPCNLVLLLASLFFYFWGEGWGVGYLALSVVVNDLLARGVARGRTSVKKALLSTAIVFNLGMLCVFKYAGFFTESVNALTGLGLPVPRILLPLGISFYTFQAMSYVIDVFRDEVRPAGSPLDFACYVTMFPQLVAGPIVRYADIARQLRARTLSWERTASGLRRFLSGLAKKAIVANTVGLMADKVWDAVGAGKGVPAPLAWLGIACYTLQIYYDFSGYSDMAIGLGRMLGFDFRENFLHPYAATSVRDFWRRWHISLSTWFRDYLYIPLGGNRKGTFRTCVNGMVVFGLCGFWHGAGVPFLLWGLWHGLFLTIERIASRKEKRSGSEASVRSPGKTRRRNAGVLSGAVGRLYTLAVVVLGWCLFRSESLVDLGFLFRCLAGAVPSAAETRTLWIYASPQLVVTLVAGVLFAFPVAPALRRRLGGVLSAPALYAAECSVLALLGVLSVVLLAGGTYNPFIYFRF